METASIQRGSPHPDHHRLPVPPGEKQKHIPALDGVRGLAILMVLFHHFVGGADGATAIGHAWLSVTNCLWTGVDLFFVLSGFLITGILWDTKQRRDYARRFYTHRALRIFPLYYGVLIVLLLAFPLVHNHIRQASGQDIYGRQIGLWLYATNFVTAFKGVHYYWAFEHFWSLAVEEHFYLIWPWVILFCPRRRALGVCVGVIAAALAIRTGMILMGSGGTPVYVITPCRMDSLALGGLAALLVRGPNPEYWYRLARPVLAVSGLLLVGMIIWRHGLPEDDPIVQSLGFSLLAVFFAAVLLRAVATKPNGLPRRLWTLRPLRFTGRIAYGLYVFHPFFIIPLSRLFEGRHGPQLGFGHLRGILIFALAGIVLSYITAFASWHLYEKHFLRLKDWLDKRRAVKDAMPVAPGDVPKLAPV